MPSPETGLHCTVNSLRTRYPGPECRLDPEKSLAHRWNILRIDDRWCQWERKRPTRAVPLDKECSLHILGQWF